MLPTDVFEVDFVCEEFELWEVMVDGVSMLPLGYVWQEDAAGECITLVGNSGLLREVLEATEEAADFLLDCSKSGDKKPCLALCLEGVREFSRRLTAS